MTQFDIDESSLKKNSLLIPVAVLLGTMIAIVAYTYLPPTTALISIFAGTSIIALVFYTVLKKRYGQ